VGLDEQLGQFSRVMSIRPKLWTTRIWRLLRLLEIIVSSRLMEIFRKFSGLNLLLLQSD
jgi:hypothetical protein